MPQEPHKERFRRLLTMLSAAMGLRGAERAVAEASRATAASPLQNKRSIGRWLWRELLADVGLTVASVLLTLLLAEGLVRVAALAPEMAILQRGSFRLARDIRLGYEPVPDGSTNSLGYRDDEHVVSKPAGCYRIVVLGDSITAGLKIAETRQAFPAVLRRVLRAHGVRAEVINLGVSGYNTGQEVAALKAHGLQFGPDVVIVAYCLNDREPAAENFILLQLLAAERAAPRLSQARLGAFLARSALYRFVLFRCLHRPGSQHDWRPGPLAQDPVPQGFADLGRLSREHGFAVLVVIFPEFTGERPYPARAEHVWVRNVAQQNGLQVLDLLNAFHECSPASLETLGIDRAHPTVEGHRCTAEAMARAILPWTEGHR